MVANAQVGYPGAESADDSLPFVAEHHRSRDVPVARDDM